MISSGQCHCGTIKFEIETSNDILVQECNCSMCAMTGFLHLIVPKSKFRLVQGQEAITSYTFNTGIAKHTFCKHCGVKPFYVPRSNPDGYSVNMRCLDQSQFKNITVESFDGQNWEKNADSLKHLSE